MTYIDRTVEKQYIAPSPVEPMVRDNGRLKKEIEMAKKTPLQNMSVENDQEFRDLVKHALKKGESLGDFISRTGLGKAQIVSQQMSPIQILKWCINAEEREKEEGWNPRREHFQPKPMPTHLKLED